MDLVSFGMICLTIGIVFAAPNALGARALPQNNPEAAKQWREAYVWLLGWTLPLYVVLSVISIAIAVFPPKTP